LKVEVVRLLDLPHLTGWRYPHDPGLRVLAYTLDLLQKQCSRDKRFCSGILCNQHRISSALDEVEIRIAFSRSYISQLLHNICTRPATPPQASKKQHCKNTFVATAIIMLGRILAILPGWTLRSQKSPGRRCSQVAQPSHRCAYRPNFLRNGGRALASCRVDGHLDCYDPRGKLVSASSSCAD
jgi:hypothetical protein